MVALILASRDGLTDLAVTYYGETRPLRGFPRYYLMLLVTHRDRTLDLSRVAGKVE
jgi:hypothetical protein